MILMLEGGFVRLLQGLLFAAPTLLVGLWIAAVMRYFLREQGIRTLFGGESLRSLPQSWLLGMLLPVCSIGVIPILREMRRAGVRPGALSAFALSAPLFNPLSLLYGLTLSRPRVIIGFALASLVIVTVLGFVWDRLARGHEKLPEDTKGPIGVRRLLGCFVYAARELVGPTGVLTVIALSGLLVLGAMLPHGALQTSVEQDDIRAPLVMTLVAIPVYATPMLAMSQLGMMFAHANSPGAAFCLLILGTGVNLATLAWFGLNYGVRPTAAWFGSLVLLVVGIAYAINGPLIPVGVEPAGHTHAFDIYTNPIAGEQLLDRLQIEEQLKKTAGLGEWAGLAVLAMMTVTGLSLRGGWGKRVQAWCDRPVELSGVQLGRFDRVVSDAWVGVTGIVGLIALSIVACYAYYPSPYECFEEIKAVKAEALHGAMAGDVEKALYWMEQWDDWSRKLEVGAVIRRFELRPYQRMQGFLLRKKLELLEHELEHEVLDLPEIEKLRNELFATSQRLREAYESSE